MTSDRSVIAAVRDAVGAAPENAALRVHLAELLVDAGEFGSGLEHAQAALRADPSNQVALRVARDSARGLGDGQQADGYERLLAALGAGESSRAAHAGQETDVVALRAVEGGRSDEDEETPGRPRVTFADVGGMEEVKRKLDAAFLGPMRNPRVRAMYEISLRGGLLLYGPPGCGKTFLARALAGELGARFMAVGLDDVLDMFLGESERRLHELFETARRAAPCVLFMDELDALGQKRSHMRHSAGRSVVNQLLAELDGVKADNEGLFFLAATNHPWDVDTALRRPGRLDRTLLVLPPDGEARRAILERSLGGRPAEGVDVDRLARQTNGFSGADLAYLCEVAAETALADSIASGTARPIGEPDFKVARRQVSPSTREWFHVAHNYALYANQGGLYDDLLAYIREHNLL